MRSRASTGERTWRDYGKRDPYYAVLSRPEFRADRIEANRESFFASGEAEVASALRRVESAVGPVSRGRALDFGAGVGRLSLPLTERFAEVHSVDVSPDMLAELEANARAAGRSGITTHTGLRDVPGDLDFALSLIVLQHIPADRGLALVLRIWSKLASGGVLALDVPMASSLGSRSLALRRIRDLVPLAQPVLNLIRRRPVRERAMQMNLYDLNTVTDELLSRGALAVTMLQTWPDATFRGALVVCRKP